jgi:hypothetical protein
LTWQEVSFFYPKKSLLTLTKNKLNLGNVRMHVHEITLQNGLRACVDVSDMGLVLPYKWHARTETRPYVQANMKIDGRWKIRLLHRHLLNAPAGMVVDHIDGNPLNNTRSNLRLSTTAQNSAHRTRPNTGQFIGVSKTDGGKWKALICTNGQDISLGTNDIEEIAAEAYNQAALVLYGKFAGFNQVPRIDGLLNEIVLKKEQSIQRSLVQIAMLKG